MKHLRAFICVLVLPILTFCISCASSKQPSKTVWNNPNKTYQEQMADEADCKNLVRISEHDVYGRGAGLVLNAVVENNRENAIFNDCMISKGYTLVSTNSLSFQSRASINSDDLMSKLTGHWESSTVKSTTRMENGITSINFDFLSYNRLLQTTIENNKSYPSLFSYRIDNDRIAIWDPLLDVNPKPNDYSSYSLIDGQMMISSKEFQLVLKKHRTQGLESNIANTANALVGHWATDLSSTNNILVAHIDDNFISNFEYHIFVENKIDNTFKAEDGIYIYDGSNLETWADAKLSPKKNPCVITNDKMVVKISDKLTVTFWKQNAVIK